MSTLKPTVSGCAEFLKKFSLFNNITIFIPHCTWSKSFVFPLFAYPGCAIFISLHLCYEFPSLFPALPHKLQWKVYNLKRKKKHSRLFPICDDHFITICFALLFREHPPIRQSFFFLLLLASSKQLSRLKLAASAPQTSAFPRHNMWVATRGSFPSPFFVRLFRSVILFNYCFMHFNLLNFTS